MRRYSLEELTDIYIGKMGTKNRAKFDNKLKLDSLKSPKDIYIPKKDIKRKYAQ